MRGAAGPVRDALTGLLADGSAIVETAEVVGITDPVGMGVPVEARSTRGMGEAIRALLDAGVRRFYVALGGSSTNDGGAGLLAGLGLKLFDAAGAANSRRRPNSSRASRGSTCRNSTRGSQTRNSSACPTSTTR